VYEKDPTFNGVMNIEYFMFKYLNIEFSFLRKFANPSFFPRNTGLMIFILKNGLDQITFGYYLHVHNLVSTNDSNKNKNVYLVDETY